MKMTLLTVGRTSSAWIREAMDDYVSRLRHYVPLTVVEIRELKGAAALSRGQIKDREGELILRALRSGDEVILLDERGREFSSLEWARNVEEKTAAGRDIVFVIGGAYGFSDAVYGRADSMLSLSRMTFSHQMVRVIFLEQLYRAFTIIKGEPYHHE